MTHKDVSFVRSVGLISALTFVSRILGLVREATFAYFFGVSRIWDAYALAFTIPNLSRRLFGEGALSAAFIPVLSEKLQQQGHQAARNLTGGVLLLLGVVLVGLVGVGELGIIIAGKFYPSLTLSLTGTMLPYMVFICMVALLAGAQNVAGRFGYPAFMPVLFNVILITGVIVGSFYSKGDDVVHVYFLAGAVLLGGVLQLALSWFALGQVDFRPTLVWNPMHPDIRRIIATMLPMMLGLGAVQINVLADRIVAILCIERGGGVAALSYAERLYQLPLGLFGIALATAIFPQLSRLAAAEDRQAFADTLQRGLRLALFVGIPASVGLWAVKTPAVRVIFERGKLDAEGAMRVSKVVGFYGLGVWAYILQHILIRGYYSLRHTKTPVQAASGMVILNLGLNLVLVQWFEESGIALATAISATIQVTILSILFSRSGQSIRWRPVFSCGARVLIVSGVMYLAIMLVNWTVGGWGESFTAGLVQLIMLVGVGIAVYIGLARVLVSEDLKYIRLAIFRSNRADV